MGREAIIKSIKANKPDVLPMPEINEALFSEDINLLETFKSNVALVGGTLKEIVIEDIDAEIKKLYPNAKQIVSAIKESSLGTIQVSEKTDPHSLEFIDLAIVNGEFGVAENGAVWVTASQSIVRALPFITNDLIIVLSKDKLCLHMLQAYDLIAQQERDFGVFISGPSKTADIEQCLVVGAHGAMSLTVLLV